MRVNPSARCVAVGIDGSRSALDAALWAVDEAVDRDLPLRLVFAIDPDCCPGVAADDRARYLAAAESAVRYAFAVIESTDKPVKIEAEILQDRTTDVLLDASRSAVLLCVGSVGIMHGRGDPIGSTAAALAIHAQCPVAVVRGHDPRPRGESWVVAEIDETADTDSVLKHALDEGRLRGAPVHVLTAWHSGYTDIHDNRAVTEGRKLAKAQLDRRLANWRRGYSDVDVQAVAVHGNSLGYLTKNADAIQLLVVGRERAGGIRELVGPPGYAALSHANCSVLICEHRN